MTTNVIATHAISDREDTDMSTQTETSRPTYRAAAGRVRPTRTATRRRRSSTGVARLVRRLEQERRSWARPAEPEIPTAQAWRAGVAEGFRLAQLAIRKGV
jgi:hypothetical protein